MLLPILLFLCQSQNHPCHYLYEIFVSFTKHVISMCVRVLLERDHEGSKPTEPWCKVRRQFNFLEEHSRGEGSWVKCRMLEEVNSRRRRTFQGGKRLRWKTFQTPNMHSQNPKWAFRNKPSYVLFIETEVPIFGIKCLYFLLASKKQKGNNFFIWIGKIQTLLTISTKSMALTISYIHIHTLW